MDSPTVVNFYTGDERYRRYAHRLQESCKALAVPCVSIELRSRGRWVINCAMKPIFMMHAMRKLARPLLWVDADGELKRTPDLLRGCDADFGIYAFPGPRRRKPPGREWRDLPHEFPDPPRWFNSGTVFLNNTRGGLDLVDRWADLQRAHPTDWDQWTLQQAWCDTRPNTIWLPQTYCAIRGRSNGPPVVNHGLASVEGRVARK